MFSFLIDLGLLSDKLVQRRLVALSGDLSLIPTKRWKSFVPLIDHLLFHSWVLLGLLTAEHSVLPKHCIRPVEELSLGPEVTWGTLPLVGHRLLLEISRVAILLAVELVLVVMVLITVAVVGCRLVLRQGCLYAEVRGVV